MKISKVVLDAQVRLLMLAALTDGMTMPETLVNYEQVENGTRFSEEKTAIKNMVSQCISATVYLKLYITDPAAQDVILDALCNVPLTEPGVIGYFMGQFRDSIIGDTTSLRNNIVTWLTWAETPERDRKDIMAFTETLITQWPGSSIKAAKKQLVFYAYYRPRDTWIFLGEFHDRERAEEVVRARVSTIGLRCLFRWEGDDYTCGDVPAYVRGKLLNQPMKAEQHD